jgi:hypothetical protein
MGMDRFDSIVFRIKNVEIGYKFKRFGCRCLGIGKSAGRHFGVEDSGRVY